MKDEPYDKPLDFISNHNTKLLLQGMEPVDLLQNRHILPTKAIPAPKPRLQADMWNNANCSPDIFRCTLTKVSKKYT